MRKIILNCGFTVSFLLSLFLVCKGQQKDSLLQVLSEYKGAARVPIIHQLLPQLWLNYPDLGMQYANEAIQISIDNQDSSNISKSLRLKAGVHYYKGQFDSMYFYNLEALNIAVSINDSTLIHNGYNNIGLYYLNLGSYQTALEYLLRSMNIKRATGDTLTIATNYNNIGMIYSKVGQYEMARSYFQKSLDQGQGISNSTIYANNNSGITYLRQQKYDIAKTYFDLAASQAELLGNLNWGALSTRGLGEIHMYQDRFDSALSNFNKSLDVCKSIDDKKGIIESEYLLAKLHWLMGNNQKAISYLNLSLNIAQNIGSRQHVHDILELYSSIYESTENKNALIKYQNLHLALKDSLFQDVINRNLSLVPIKLKEESDRITLARQESVIANTKALNRLYITILLVSAPILVLLILLLRKVELAHRMKKSKLKEIAHIEAHEIRGPISTILGLINLLETDKEHPGNIQLYAEKMKEVAEKTDRVIKDVIKKSEED